MQKAAGDAVLMSAGTTGLAFADVPVTGVTPSTRRPRTTSTRSLSKARRRSRLAIWDRSAPASRSRRSPTSARS